MKTLSDIISDMTPDDRTYIERKAQQLVQEMEAEREKKITTTEDHGEPSEHEETSQSAEPHQPRT